MVTFAAFNLNFALNSDKFSSLKLADLVSLAKGEGDCDCKEMMEVSIGQPCYVEPSTGEGLFYCSCTLCVNGGSGCSPTCPCCSD